MSRDLNSWLLPQDSSGYIVGVRGWYAYSEHLQSLCFDCSWPVGRPLECEVPLLQECGAKYEGIEEYIGNRLGYSRKVGIFAFKTLKQVLSSGFDQHLVGEVALWGEVAEHEEGYRAQYAYPLTVAEAPQRMRYYTSPTNPLPRKGLEIARLYGCKYVGGPS